MAKQFEDDNLNKLRKKTALGMTKATSLTSEDILSSKGRIWVPRVEDLTLKLLIESHGS